MDPAHAQLKAVVALAQDVAKELGKGRSEAVYQKALGVALQAAGIQHVMEETITIFYCGQAVGQERIDLTLHGFIDAVVELKAVAKLKTDDVWQLQKYMHSKKVRYGILLNFSQTPGQPLGICVLVGDHQYNFETFALTDLPSAAF
jgi:GxxExxY protein